MQIAIVGSREQKNFTAEDMAAYIPQGCTRIFSGGARGVDTLARRAAQILGVPITELLPDYARYGRRAPLVRNAEIVAHADLVLAFWDQSSHGTAHIIALCRQQNVPVQIIDLNQWKEA